MFLRVFIRQKQIEKIRNPITIQKFYTNGTEYEEMEMKSIIKAEVARIILEKGDASEKPRINKNISECD